MKQLIDAGADVNRSPKNGVSPLHWAVAKNLQMVDLLIAAGANVNTKDDKGERRCTTLPNPNKAKRSNCC